MQPLVIFDIFPVRSESMDQASSSIKVSQTEKDMTTIMMEDVFMEIENTDLGLMVLDGTGKNERKMYPNNIFCNTFISALEDKKADLNNDGEIYIQELMFYLEAKVYEDSNGSQTPYWKSYNPELNFRIW